MRSEAVSKQLDCTWYLTKKASGTWIMTQYCAVNVSHFLIVSGSLEL